MHPYPFTENKDSKSLLHTLKSSEQLGHPAGPESTLVLKDEQQMYKDCSNYWLGAKANLIDLTRTGCNVNVIAGALAALLGQIFYGGKAIHIKRNKKRSLGP